VAKPTFRFEVNLKKKKETHEPAEVLEVADARKWEREVEERLNKLPPARVRIEDWDDDLTANELLAAYNASLQRGQKIELGNRVEATIEYSVFIDEWENKHIVTQPLGAKGSRLSELMVNSDGNLLRLSLERYDGPVLSLDCYLGIGISEFSDDELKRVPGYGLQMTRYHREGDYLVGVEQVRKRYDPAQQKIINDQEFML